MTATDLRLGDRVTIGPSEDGDDEYTWLRGQLEAIDGDVAEVRGDAGGLVRVDVARLSFATLETW